MILHCTQKLAARIPATTDLPNHDTERAAQAHPLSSWHGHLLTLDRRQCILFCHDVTRYVLFLPGLRAPQFAELGRWHRELFLAVLQAQGLAHHHIARAGLTLGALQMDRNTDRSVLASMNRVAGDLQFGFLQEMTNVMELDPIKTSLWLNDRPCTVHKAWIWPDKAMREIVEALYSEKRVGSSDPISSSALAESAASESVRLGQQTGSPLKPLRLRRAHRRSQ